MPKNYRLVVFDWEGTLGDNIGHLVDVIKKAALSFHLGDVEEQSIRDVLSEGLTSVVKKLFPHCELRIQQQLFEAIQRASMERNNKTYLFQGASDILTQLHQAGIELAIATNKGQASLKRVLNETNLGDLFVTTQTASQSLPKPSPMMLEEIMHFCNIPPEETLVVGDSVSDIEMAMVVQVDAVGMDFYNQAAQKKALSKAGALEVFTSFKDLAGFLHISYQG
jgi:phosphoglycolate phosphatase